MVVYEKMCDQDGVVRGIVTAVNEIDDFQKKEKIIKKLFQPFAIKLMEIAKLDDNLEPEIQKQSDAMSVMYIEKITIIIDNLKKVDENNPNQQPHVMVEILKEMWPLIDAFLKKYKVRNVLT